MRHEDALWRWRITAPAAPRAGSREIDLNQSKSRFFDVSMFDPRVRRRGDDGIAATRTRVYRDEPS
jgi:hypothetical protein